MDKNQLDLLQAPFSSSEIKQREGSYGKTLDYLETHTVIQRLNNALDGDWDFQVASWEVDQEADEVIVLGKLTAGGITKAQFGSAKRKRQKQSGNLISLGDDIKAAASDALKQCETLLGVGLHLYRSEEVTTPHPETYFGYQRSAPPRQPDQRQQESATTRPYRTHPDRTPQISQAPPRHSSDSREVEDAGAGAGSRGSGTSSNSTRLSQKQYSYLQQLAQKCQLSATQFNDFCRQTYGVLPAFLNRQDASQLIDQLQQGHINAHHPDHAA